MHKKELIAQNEIIKEVINELPQFQLTISLGIMSIGELKKELSRIINDLITNDFSRLTAILYRLDISEKKLKELLKSSIDTSAGNIIAEMIIERQTEKIQTRKLFSTLDSNCNEEKW